MTDCAQIVILAKYPAAGQVKTRLIAALGADGAANLARQLLQHTLRQALATGYSVELCGSPAADHSCWQSLSLPIGLKQSSQCEGDLGARMAHAAQHALQHHQAVLLIGTDCPSLDSATLQRAAQSLEQYDAVIIPAADGGYVLLGLRCADPSLFEQMAWSTATVCADTLQRLVALNWSVSVLPRLHDIDNSEDLQHLPVQWCTGQC